MEPLFASVSLQGKELQLGVVIEEGLWLVE